VFEASGWEAKSIATTTRRGLVLLASGEAAEDAFEIRY